MMTGRFTHHVLASRPAGQHAGAALHRAVGGLLAAALLLLAGPVLAVSGLAQLKAFLADTQSARGEFTQKVQRGERTVESTQGVFAFVRPGKFRWEVRKPFEQLMVADGERLWFHDRDLNQVTLQKLGPALGATPAALLFGQAELDRSFELSEQGERDGLAWVEARPRQADQGFDRIAIGLRDGLPVAMQVHDAFGRVSVFGFSGIERNVAASPGLFQFVPPAGADLIEQK